MLLGVQVPPLAPIFLFIYFFLSVVEDIFMILDAGVRSFDGYSTERD